MNTPNKPLKLYYTPQDHIAPQGSGLPDARSITGDADTDAWLDTLPAEERASAIQEIMNPELSAEDINELVKRGGYRFNNKKEFDVWERWKKDQETSLVQDMGNAASEVGRVFKDLATVVYKDPQNAIKKGIPSVLEGAFQNLVDTYGMVAQSANPDSVLFGIKDALYGTGTIESRMAQTNTALDFMDRSARLYEGKETLLLDKSYIDPEITRAMTYIADPTMFVPFGGVVMKGARAVGAGDVLTKAALRANRIKANVLGGAIKWGAGAPIEAIGGALRDSIEYGVQKTAGAFEGLTGISAKETAQTVRLAGMGTATAHVAGVTVPFAGPLSATYIGGGAARGFGSALRMVGDQIVQRQGHRGVLSFAKEAIEETKKVGKLSPQTETFLKIIDKADPVLSYAYDMGSGAAQGMFIGGLLGYLNDKKQGMAMGMGMGGTLGAGGALFGRVVSDVAGSTRKMREEVTADFILRVLKDKDQMTARDLQRLRDDPRTSKEVREVMNKVIVMLDRAEEPIIFRAYENSAEFSRWKSQNPEIGGISTAEFRNSEGWQIRRRDGNVEIGINMENFFGTDRTRQNKFAANTVPHEFLHAVFEASVLGPHFKEMARDLMIGVRDKDGKISQKGVLTPESVRGFMRKYVSNVATGATAAERHENAKRLRQSVDDALDAWSKEGNIGSVTKLTEEQGALLRHLTEEMSAYYFGHWFQGKSMEFFLRGGELEGLSGMFEHIADSWKDFWEDNLEAHAPRMRFYANENIEAGFMNGGSRVRVGALDYFMRDVIRATSQIRQTGVLDMSRMSSGMIENLLKNHGIDDIVSRDSSGRARVKTQKRYEADMAQRNAEIFRVLDSLDPAKRTSVKGPDGVIRGPFSEFELKTLVQAGLLTDGFAEKLRLIQNASDNKNLTNVMWFSYLGESMETGVGPNPPRVYGSKVAVKNRKAIVVGYNFEVDANGKGAFRIRTLDLAVIERRGRSFWMEDAVRNLWGGDHSAYMSDFYRYLANASKAKNDPTRVPSAVLLGESGEFKRDVLHQVAGFAKSDDLAYINSPLAPVPRGMLSAVTDFTVGRMFNVRGLGERIVYEHQNAFHDIAANFKAVDLTNRYRDYTEEELAEGRRIHFDDTPYGYYEVQQNGKKQYILYMDEGADKQIIYRTNKYEEIEKAFDDHLEKVLEEWRTAKDKKIESDRRKLETQMPVGLKIAQEAKTTGDLRKSETLRRVLLNRGISDENTFLLTADEQYRLGKTVLRNTAMIESAVSNFGPWRLAADTQNGRKNAVGTPVALMAHFVIGDTAFLEHMSFRRLLQEGKVPESFDVAKRTVNFESYLTAHSSAARAARYSSQKLYMRAGQELPATGQQVRGLIMSKNPLRWEGPTNQDLGFAKTKQDAQQLIYNSKLQAIRYAKENGHDLIIYNNRKRSRTDDASGDRYEYIVINTEDKNIIPLQANYKNMPDGTIVRDPKANMQELPRVLSKADISMLNTSPEAMSALLRRYTVSDVGQIKPEYWDASYDKAFYTPHRGNNLPEYPVRFFKPKDEADYVNQNFATTYANETSYADLHSKMHAEVQNDHSYVFDYFVGVNRKELVADYNEYIARLESSLGFNNVDETEYNLNRPKFVVNHYEKLISVQEEYQFAGAQYWAIRNLVLETDRFGNNLSSLLKDNSGMFLQDNVAVNHPAHGSGGTIIRDDDGKVVPIEAQSKIFGFYVDALASIDLVRKIREASTVEQIEAVKLEIEKTGNLAFLEHFKIVNDPSKFAEMVKLETELGNMNSVQRRAFNRGAEILGLLRTQERIVEHMKGPAFKQSIESLSGGIFTVEMRKQPTGITNMSSSGVMFDGDFVQKFYRKNEVEVPTIVFTDAAIKFAQIYRDTTPFSRDPRSGDPDQRVVYNQWSMEIDRNNLQNPPDFGYGVNFVPDLMRERGQRIFEDANVKAIFDYLYKDSPAVGETVSWKVLARTDYSRDIMVSARRALRDKNEHFETYKDSLENTSSYTYDGWSANRIYEKNKELRNGRMDYYRTLVDSGRIKSQDVAFTDFDQTMKNLEIANQQLDNASLNADALNHARKNLSNDEFGELLTIISAHARTREQIVGLNRDVRLLELSEKAGEFLSNNYNYTLKTTLWNESLVRRLNREAQEIKIRYKDIDYEGVFKSGLKEGVARILADNPKGITPENMLKELQKINSSGLMVLDEAKVTGFLDYLKERSAIKRENGKTEKLDVADVERYLAANSLTVNIERDAKFDVNDSNYFVGYQKHLLRYGTLSARVKEQKFWPAILRGGNHVGMDTIVWTRFTIREVEKPDGTKEKILYIEEIQANNDKRQREEAEAEVVKEKAFKEKSQELFAALARTANNTILEDGISLSQTEQRILNTIIGDALESRESASFNAIRKLGDEDLTFDTLPSLLDDFINKYPYAVSSPRLRRELGFVNASTNLYMRTAVTLAEDGLVGTRIFEDSIWGTLEDIPARMQRFDNFNAMHRIVYSNGWIFEDLSNAGPAGLYSEHGQRAVRDIAAMLESPEFVAKNPIIASEWQFAKNNLSTGSYESMFAGFMQRLLSQDDGNNGNNIVAKVLTSVIAPNYAQKLRKFYDGYIDRAEKTLRKKGMHDKFNRDLVMAESSVGERQRAFYDAPERGVSPNSADAKYSYIPSEMIGRQVELEMVADFMKIPEEQLSARGRRIQRNMINNDTSYNDSRYHYTTSDYAHHFFFTEFLRNNLIKDAESSLMDMSSLPDSQSKRMFENIVSTNGGREFLGHMFFKYFVSSLDAHVGNGSSRRLFETHSDIMRMGTDRGYNGILSMATKARADKIHLSAIKALAETYLSGDFYDEKYKHLSERVMPRSHAEIVIKGAQASMLRYMAEVFSAADNKLMVDNLTPFSKMVRNAILYRHDYTREVYRERAYDYPNKRTALPRYGSLDGIPDDASSRQFTDFGRAIRFKADEILYLRNSEQGEHGRIGKKNDEVVDSILSPHSLLSAMSKMAIKENKMSNGVAVRELSNQFSGLLTSTHPEFAELLGVNKGGSRQAIYMLADSAAKWTAKEQQTLQLSGLPNNGFDPNIPDSQIKNKETKNEIIQKLGNIILGEYFYDPSNVQAREKVLKVPFLSSNEYVKIASRMLIKQAILSGVDRIVMTHPHDGGSRSGLPQLKAEYMYSKLNPEIFKKEYKPKGIDVKSRGFADIPSVLPYLQQAFELGKKKGEIEKVILLPNPTPENGYAYPTATNMAVNLADASAQQYNYTSKKENITPLRWDDSLKQLTSERRAIGAYSDQETSHKQHWGIAGMDVHNAVMNALKSGLRDMDGSDSYSGKRTIEERTRVIDTILNHYTINLRDGLLQMFESFYPDSMVDVASQRKNADNIIESDARLEEYRKYRDTMLKRDDANNYKELFDWADTVFDDISTQVRLAYQIFESPEIQAGGLNAFIDRRGVSANMSQLTPKGLDDVNKGMTSFKPVDGITGVQDVSLGTPQFRSKFISDYARTVHRLADSARIHVIEREHSDKMRSNFTLTISPRGNKRLGMETRDVTVEGYADFGNMAGNIEVVDRDASGEYAELAREEMVRRFEIMGIDIGAVTGDSNKKVEPYRITEEMDEGVQAPRMNDNENTEPVVSDIGPNANYKPKASADKTAWSERKEGNGLTVTSLDGYLIMLSKTGGYRLYSPQKALIGVYKTEEEARKKAAKVAQ